MKSINSMYENPYIHIGFKIKKKNGRSLITTPGGGTPIFKEVSVDNTLLKALAKAHLWQRELKRGKHSSINDLAEKKKITNTYVGKIMKLNYLSPKIKAMILDGKQPKDLKLQDLMIDMPLFWLEQESKFLT